MARTKRKNNNKFLVVSIVSLIVIFSLMKLFVWIFAPRMVVAEVGELSQTISSKGLVLRKETLIIVDVAGNIIYEYTDGERVGRNKQVASIYLGNVDENLQLRLNYVDEQIRSLQLQNDNMAYFSGNSQQFESQIYSLANSIISSSNAGNFEKVASAKKELVNLVAKKDITSKGGDLANLIAERDSIQREIGDVKHNILSPISGVFVSKIDGYEKEFLNFDIFRLNPSDINRRDTTPKSATKVQQGDAVGKIVENYDWYYATQINSKVAKAYEVGKVVSVEFSDASQDVISATVVANYDGEEGKKIVVVECHETVDSAATFRWINAKIYSTSQKGLKIPKSAVVVLDAVSGVYINKDGLARFRPIEILISDDDYAIVKKTDDAKNLQLYDRVLVDSFGLYDGKDI